MMASKRMLVRTKMLEIARKNRRGRRLVELGLLLCYPSSELWKSFDIILKLSICHDTFDFIDMEKWEKVFFSEIGRNSD